MQVVSLEYPNNNPNIGQYISHLKLDEKAECKDCEPVFDDGLMVHTYQLQKNGGTQSLNCLPQPICVPGEYLSGGPNPSTSVKESCEACQDAEFEYTDKPQHQDASCKLQPRCDKGNRLAGQRITIREQCVECGDFEYMDEEDHRQLKCKDHPICDKGDYVCDGSVCNMYNMYAYGHVLLKQ